MEIDGYGWSSADELAGTEGASRFRSQTFTLQLDHLGNGQLDHCTAIGLAQDAVFAGIVLVDPTGMQIGIAKTLNSNHQAIVGNPFVIPAGTTKTFTIAGNMNARSRFIRRTGRFDLM